MYCKNIFRSLELYLDLLAVLAEYEKSKQKNTKSNYAT